MTNISGNYACCRGLVTLANRFCWYISSLWLPTCVDEMGWGILVTVKYRAYWSQMREGCKVTINHRITDVDFPNLMGGCNLV